MEHTILLFYKYVHIENPEQLRDVQRALCEKLGLKGRIIVAHEGINATVEGTTEAKVGRFKNSIMPTLQNFRDIPKALSEIEDLKDKTVLTVCTGGVRCEKASGLLKREGFKDVHQLDGGMVTYMEKFPGGEFEGSLYVFDKRITMTFDPADKHKVIGKCDKCETASERYVNCKYPRCNKHFICCESCSEEDGRSFCSEECRDKVIVTA